MRRRGFGGRGFGPRPMGRMGMRPVPHRRFFRPGLGWRPIPSGMFTLLTFASSGMLYKIHRDEVARLEQYSGKPVHEMGEEEVVAAFNALGIKSERLSADDRQTAKRGNRTTLEDLALLEKLTQMHYAGTITEEEYNAKRKQILGLG